MWLVITGLNSTGQLQSFISYGKPQLNIQKQMIILNLFVMVKTL